jgi:hypothetical protein
MKKYITAFIIMNAILSAIYMWGADNNRIYCLLLWFLAPTLNFILLAFAEKGAYNG